MPLGVLCRIVGSKLCLGRCPVSAELSDADIAIRAFVRPAGVALLKSAQCARALGDCFVYLSFYSPFATVTDLGAVPLNLKGMSYHFVTAAHKGFPIVPLFCPTFCLGRPQKGGFRPSGLDSFVCQVCKGEGFEGFDLRVRCVLSPLRNYVCCSPFCRGLLISFGLGVCAPEFNLIGARMRVPMQCGLGVSTFSGTRLRRSRHLPFRTRKSRAVESPGSRGTRYT
ncbi:hypothetical protein CRG98_008479 [Punica granatum]|uniref:Uncharacterized protein n=1 Tax=Punica granatum TaxID=22663 RepID=A0A2I0KRL7_PUNGR|nr:hypothetical protein CRG98_008479 [Punica granatum]